MNKTLYIFLFLTCISANTAIGQQAEIIKSLRIHTLEEFGVEILGKNVIQNNHGDYYAILSSNFNDIIIDDEVFVNNSLPEEYASEDDYSNLILLIKINDDLELQNVVQIKNVKHIALKMAVSDDQVVVAFEQRKHVQIGNEILPFYGSGKKQTLLSFDSSLDDMNEINIPNLDTYIGELLLSEEFLYIGARFEIDFQKFEYGNSTLSNFFLINESTQDTTFGGSTPFIIQYDITDQKVNRAWKFGGLGLEYVINMQLDYDNNIVINGFTNTLKWVTFDGLDSIDVQSYETAYLVKYNPMGDLIFGNLFTEWESVNAVHVYLENDDSYVSFSYRGDSMKITGLDILNRQLDGSTANSTYFSCKFNGDGGLEWVHSLNPLARKYRIVNIIGDEEEIIIVGALTENIKVDILGETHTNETKMNLLLTLDKESGEILSSATSNANHEDVMFDCLALNSNEEIYLLYQTVSKHNLWGNDFDTWYLGGFFDTRSIDQYFLKLDLSFLTNTYDLQSTSKLMKISPNPVYKNGYIKVTLTDNEQGNWKLFTSFGKVVKSGSFNSKKEIEIDILDLDSGQYILHFNNEIKMQNEIVIII